LHHMQHGSVPSTTAERMPSISHNFNRNLGYVSISSGGSLPQGNPRLVEPAPSSHFHTSSSSLQDSHRQFSSADLGIDINSVTRRESFNKGTGTSAGTSAGTGTETGIVNGTRSNSSQPTESAAFPTGSRQHLYQNSQQELFQLQQQDQRLSNENQQLPQLLDQDIDCCPSPEEENVQFNSRSVNRDIANEAPSILPSQASSNDWDGYFLRRND
jgi:hypothetical protein